MVDLSTVKMPVVEYENGSREPVCSFWFNKIDGCYEINSRCFQPNGSAWSDGPGVRAIHAAYAAHLEQQQKPVLVWDESLDLLVTAKDEVGCVYVVRSKDGKEWYAEVYSTSFMSLIGGGIKDYEEAKAACERHARGE